MVKFISGCVVGALLLLGVEVAGAFILYRTFMGGMSDTLMDAADPPPFPEKTKEVFSGTIELLDMDGNTVQVPIGDGEILIVNQWATWCPPCNAEMPALAELTELTRDKGVRVICVSDEPLAILQSWRAKNDSKAPIYALSSMPMKLGGDGIPETWIINGRGEVEFKHTGMANWAHESVYAYLAELGAGVSVPSTPQEGTGPENADPAGKTIPVTENLQPHESV